MSESTDRAARIVAAGLGDAAGAEASALLLAAAVTTHQPALAATLALAAPFLGPAVEEGFLALRSKWRREGVQEFAEAVEAETHVGVEEFVSKLDADRKTRRLFGEAVAAAAEQSDEWNVRLLARAFVVGAKDATMVDPMRELVRATVGLDGMHARVLAALSVEPYKRTVDDVAKVDPGLGHTTALLSRSLERLGLVEIVGNVVSLSITGWSVASLLKQIDSLPEPGPGKAT